MGLTTNAPAYRYTPDTGFAHTGGNDTITFTATDSYGAITEATAAIVVAPINQAPTITVAVGAADPETGTRLITPTASDPDGDAVTIAVTSAPAHGTLIDHGDGISTYTPDAAFAHTGGDDTITFTATDNYGATTQFTATVTVQAINHAPTVAVALVDTDTDIAYLRVKPPTPTATRSPSPPLPSTAP